MSKTACDDVTKQLVDNDTKNQLIFGQVIFVPGFIIILITLPKLRRGRGEAFCAPTTQRSVTPPKEPGRDRVKVAVCWPI